MKKTVKEFSTSITKYYLWLLFLVSLWRSFLLGRSNSNGGSLMSNTWLSHQSRSHVLHSVQWSALTWQTRVGRHVHRRCRSRGIGYRNDCTIVCNNLPIRSHPRFYKLNVYLKNLIKNKQQLHLKQVIGEQFHKSH